MSSLKVLKRLFSTVLLVLVCLTVGCDDSSSEVTDESGQVSGELTSNEADFLMNGFDIRTIGEYPEIEAEIRSSIEKESGELTREDFLKVTTLWLVDRKISDLAPLAALENLGELNLDSNEVVDLSPLSSLDKLHWLSFQSNNVVDLSPISELNLTDLRICQNGISDITPLGSLKKLERLSISMNPIRDVSALAKVETLLQVLCADCPIEDYSPLAHVRRVEPPIEAAASEK